MKRIFTVLFIILALAGIAGSGVFVYLITCEKAEIAEWEDKIEESESNYETAKEDLDTVELDVEAKEAERDELAIDLEDILMDLETANADLEDARAEAQERDEEEKQRAEEEKKIHEYELRVFEGDVAWDDAFVDAEINGGYIAHINFEEEWDIIAAELTKQGATDVVFFLGGFRPQDTEEYFWIDGEGNPYGEAINSDTYWAKSAWADGEPSMGEGDVREDFILAYYDTEKQSWLWKDVPYEVVAEYPELSGKLGYILERE